MEHPRLFLYRRLMNCSYNATFIANVATDSKVKAKYFRMAAEVERDADEVLTKMTKEELKLVEKKEDYGEKAQE